ncbi:ankyrin [Xylaria castorea]|nr:ankyrin [Xylaria castorea]
MDPFSTATSALQIASLAGALLKSIYRFVEQTRTVVDSIQELYDEIRHLEAALHDIGETFRKRPRQLSFECRHHERIKEILDSCRNSLEQLDHELPELRDETTPIQKLKLSIQKSLKGERLKEMIHHVISYTRILQLSLSTLSLGELWINRESQGMILAEVRKINQAIRATELFSGRAETRTRTQQLPVTPTPQPYTSPAEREARSSLDKEKRDWRETVDEITAAVSLSIPDDDSIDGRLTISMHSTPSKTTLKTFDNDGSDSEQEELDDMSRRVIRLTLESNQDIVRELMQSEIYFQAAKYQRRGINQRKRLNQKLARQNEEYDSAGDISNLENMREMLADILFHCDTTETDDEAEKVLEELLRENERLGMDDTDREWRLYHKLGNLYAKQGNFRKSEKFLKKAFMGRSRANPRRQSLVIESAEILIKSLQVLQLIDEARGIQCLLEEEWPAEPSSTNQSSPQLSPRASFNGNGDLSGAYRWSVKQGFDVHNPHFGFDVCDPETGNAPIHLAIRHQNLEVLQSMLMSNPHVEQRDSMGATPIHLAATTRNKRVCALLLEKAADVNVEDQKKRSPLHRCQSSSGGVQGVEVAKLILDGSPNLIDHIDYIGKTALCMACEQGNVNMAAFLLERGANPNRGNPGQFIPLVSAIDAVAQSRRATIRLVKLLLEKGADARLRDGDGRTAFDAANNAGLAAGEIKKLLNNKLWRRPSITSIASTVDTARTSSTGTPTSGGTSLSASTTSRRSVKSWRGLRGPNQPPE